jgi:lysozyme
MITKETVDLIKQFEGLRLKAYRDSVGVLTIGYGHTKGVHSVMKITDSQASEYLVADLRIASTGVRDAISKPMTSHEFGAFISLTHNIGVGAFTNSTAARKFNKGDKNGAAKAILMWNKITIDGKKVVSQGLVNRRSSEAVYFKMNVADASLPTHFYETTAGDGGAHTKAAPPAWPIIGTLATAIALFFDQIKEFFVGFI